MSRKDFVLKTFRGEPSDRIPVGFWYHYLKMETINGLKDPEIFESNLAGVRRYKAAIDPDFVKIMTDGFFFLPLELAGNTPADLAAIKIGNEQGKYVDRFSALAAANREIFGEDIPLFINVFGPLTTVGFLLQQDFFEFSLHKKPHITSLLELDPDAVAQALDTVADGIIEEVRASVGPGKADGIYFSVNDPNSSIPEDVYRTYVTPSEKKIIALANSLSQDNILHICGYEGNKNILSIYRDYDVECFNWAVHTEGMSLGEGKRFFSKAKSVLGGFGNTTKDILYKGSRQEIEEETDHIIENAGRDGLILGADCTVPRDTDPQRFIWVREQANR